MLHTSNNNQDLFLHSFIVVLVVAVYLSTMQFGNQLSFLGMRLTSLSLNPSWENILIVQLLLPIYLRKLRYLEFVLVRSIRTWYRGLNVSTTNPYYKQERVESI